MYVVNSNLRDPAFFSRYCKRNFLRNIISSSRISVEDLLKIGCKIGRRSILIPTTDEDAVFVAENASLLKEWFIFPNQNAELVRSLCNKMKMHYLAKRFKIPTAEAIFPLSRQDATDFLKTASFPIVLKVIDGWRLKASIERNVIVHTERELLEKYEFMQDPVEPNLMLQEYIPGEDDTVWMFNGYFNERSDCLVGFSGKKIRQWPLHRGLTSLGICSKNECLEKVTKDFMRAINYKGILDVGYRFDSRDGRYKVLDVNPRVGATFRLFVSNTQMDVVRALYLDMTGQPIIAGVAEDGRKWLVEDIDWASSLCSHSNGSLSLKNWSDSYRGVREAAYFAHDDPLPFVKVWMNKVANFHSVFRELRSHTAEA